MNKDNWKLRVW